ncbi:hypothetical protein EAX61_08865 [Dokdonia sinensis]|uniref:Uncharacterized protein n=1 Tax=Dokdonia sinensis TaxID=2479847 RepID=A0A3M0G2I3_9FLAO|nr:STM3941 family protein [Dokdonia sinensis]RMB59160.1 hypothetical protein EAX61_08865 [Dokdonia sinensis]
MDDSKQISIGFNKLMLSLYFLGSLAFVAIGVLFMIKGEFGLVVLGSFSVLFFGAAGLSVGIKALGSKPAIQIGQKGIVDNGSGVSAGFIPWNDIISIRTSNMATHQFLYIQTKDNLAYINKQKNFLKRYMMRLNERYFGGGITIPTKPLEKPGNEVYEALQNALSEYHSHTTA